MVKPRSQKLAQPIKPNPSQKTIEKLADKIADKPYGKKLEAVEDNDNGEELERITISIPRSMKYALDDLMLDRKRNKKPNRTASAIIREALKVYLKKYEV
jgi:hypothetical protein